VRKLVAMLVTVGTIGAVAGDVAAYPSGGALPPPLTLVIQIAGADGVPIDAVGAALNVTVTNPAAPGFLTVYPCGDRPLASNLNYVADQTVPNFVISALSVDGEVCIDTIAIVDVVVDLDGYLPAGSPVVTLPQPTRIVDSRIGVGLSNRMQPTDVAPFQVGGVAGVPADASMVLLNATAVGTGAPGFLTVFPCGEAIPSTSTLNFQTNAIVPNFVVARLGAGGQVCAYTIAPMDLVIDVAGFVPTGAAGVVALQSPQRVLDSRDGTGGTLAPLGPAERSLQVSGVSGVPANATGVIANLTATRSSASGFVTAYPCGAGRPLASNLNFTPGANVANMAVLRLAADGKLCIVANTAVDVIVDVTGYLTDDSVITSVQPTRLYDSREGVDPVCNLGVRATQTGVEIVDPRTGAVLASATLFSGTNPTPRAFVRDDCQHVDVAGSDAGYYRGWELDRSGHLLDSYALWADADDVMFTNFGPLILYTDWGAPDHNQSLRDAITNDVLFNLPTQAPDGTPRGYFPIGATADLSLLAFLSTSPGQPHKTVSYWTLDGVNVGDAANIPDGNYFNYALSPLGTYLSVDTSNGGFVGNLIVTTLDGVEVTRLSDTWLSRPTTWMTDGSMSLCYGASPDKVHASRWDLFSPVQQLMPGAPNYSCLLAAS
jgi:hypothetical protein